MLMWLMRIVREDIENTSYQTCFFMPEMRIHRSGDRGFLVGVHVAVGPEGFGIVLEKRL